jgi:hypothetical protein
VEGIALHADRTREQGLAVGPTVNAHLAAIRPVAYGLDQTGVGELAHEQGDARLWAVELAGEGALNGSIQAARGDHQEKVVALLGKAELGQRLSHDGLSLREGAAQLGDELDVGQRVPRQLRPLGEHVQNVHAERVRGARCDCREVMPRQTRRPRGVGRQRWGPP